MEEGGRYSKRRRRRKRRRRTKEKERRTTKKIKMRKRRNVFLTGRSGLGDFFEPIVEFDVVLAALFGRFEEFVGIVEPGDLLAVSVLTLVDARLVILRQPVQSSLLRRQSRDPLLRADGGEAMGA